MIDRAMRHHGLETVVGSFVVAENSGLKIVVETDRAYLNLRGDSEDVGFKENVEAVLAQALPTEPNTISQEAHQICWLGPNEWLVVTDAASATSLYDGLCTALKEQHAAVNEQSGGLIGLRLQGKNAGQVLAKGCTIDLHPDEFPARSCAQSGLAKAPVLVIATDDEDSYLIVVRRSFSDYLLRWLVHAGSEYGVNVSVA